MKKQLLTAAMAIGLSALASIISSFWSTVLPMSGSKSMPLRVKNSSGFWSRYRDEGGTYRRSPVKDSPDLQEQLRQPLPSVGEPQEAGVVGPAGGHVQDPVGLQHPHLPEGVGVAGDVPVDVGPHAPGMVVDVEDDGDHVGGLQDLGYACGVGHGDVSLSDVCTEEM